MGAFGGRSFDEPTGSLRLACQSLVRGFWQSTFALPFALRASAETRRVHQPISNRAACRAAARLPFRQPGLPVADGGYRMRLVVGSAIDLHGSFKANLVDGSVRARELGRRGGDVAHELDANARAGPPPRQNDSVQPP